MHDSFLFFSSVPLLSGFPTQPSSQMRSGNNLTVHLLPPGLLSRLQGRGLPLTSATADTHRLCFSMTHSGPSSLRHTHQSSGHRALLEELSRQVWKPEFSFSSTTTWLCDREVPSLLWVSVFP